MHRACMKEKKNLDAVSVGNTFFLKNKPKLQACGYLPDRSDRWADVSLL